MFKRRHESSLGTGGRPTWKKRKILPQQKTHDCCYCIPTGKVSFSRSRIYKQFRIFSATDGYCETEVPQATAEHGNNAKMHAGVISGRSLHLRLRVSILSDVHPTFCKTTTGFSYFLRDIALLSAKEFKGDTGAVHPVHHKQCSCDSLRTNNTWLLLWGIDSN